VKLLTYVSIFYLPLAFCAVSSSSVLCLNLHSLIPQALWAIPNITEASTRTPFIIAAALIGFVTYMIVFNLNSLVSFGWATYSGLRDHSIQQMKQNYSAEQKWGKLGRDFKRFEPKHGNTKPSDWYILLYYILHPLALFKKSAPSAIASEETSEKDAKPQRALSWTRWLNLSNRKSKLDNRKGKGKEGGV
jgi:hypothetical protein